MNSLSEREVEEVANFVRNNEIDSIAELLLFVLGFKSHLSGTKYIRECIVLKYESNELSCNDLYCEIANKFRTERTCVERSMRHAINESHGNGYLERMNDLFRYKIVNCNYTPTNGEFVAEICTWVHIVKNKKM